MSSDLLRYTRLSVLSFLQPRAKSTEGGDEIFQINVSAV